MVDECARVLERAERAVQHGDRFGQQRDPLLAFGRNPAARSAMPSARGAPNARASSTSSNASSRAARTSPSSWATSAAVERQGVTAGLRAPHSSSRRPVASSSWYAGSSSPRCTRRHAWACMAWLYGSESAACSRTNRSANASRSASTVPWSSAV